MAITARLPLAWLLPRADESGRDLARRTQLRISFAVVAANLLGAAIVFAIGVWVLPSEENDPDESEVRIVNLIALAVYFAIVTPLAIVYGRRRLLAAIDWLRGDREPTAEERRAALRAPR